MSYRRRYRRRYRRPAAPAQQQPDGCLVGMVVTFITWGLCIIAVGIAVELGFYWGLGFLAVGICILMVICAVKLR